MNFLSKTLSTLTGTSIPYTIKEEIAPTSNDHTSIWKIYNGTNPKTEHSPVTIFEFNLKDPVNFQRNSIALAKNCFKKLKLIKFPGIVTIIDFIENDNYLYLITEPVTPLYEYLKANNANLGVDAKIYGIHNIANSILFINMKCQSLHGSLSIFNDSVFVDSQGDWKLFGFELLTNLTSDPDQPIYRLSNYTAYFSDDLPDDVVNQGVDSIRSFPIKFDSYKLGVFIYLLFTTDNFEFPRTSRLANSDLLNAPSSKFPRPLVTPFKRLVSSKPNLRITIEKFLQETSTYFDSNKLVSFSKELRDIQFKNDGEKLNFFKYELSHYLTEDNTDNEIKFPPGFLDNKLLPELINQYNYLLKAKSNSSSTPEEIQNAQETTSILLNHIIKFSPNLSSTLFNKSVKPIIVAAFASPDRSIRLILLTNLQLYSQLLTESDIQLTIFYNLITGFQDTNFMIRESTLTSIITIIDKVSTKQVNQDLLKVLAKSQMDPKPSIRTNTLILIIKISGKIYSNSKNNVLITALSKSLRDPFVPCKMMALSGFEKLIDEFSLEEICSKVLGHLAISLMDNKSYKVRQEARRIFDLYLKSVEKHAATLPKDEVDEDFEEKEFFKKNAPSNSGGVQEAQESASSGGFQFGWNMVNKLVSSSVEGQLNNEFNSSTPDLTRVSTPSTNTIFESEASKLADKKQPKNNAWAATIADDGLDGLDDGWGEDIIENDPVDPPANTSTPNIQGLSLGNGKPKTIKPIQSRANSSNSVRKGRTLKLGKVQSKKPGSTLKLDLTMDDDDSWGGDGW